MTRAARSLLIVAIAALVPALPARADPADTATPDAAAIARARHTITNFLVRRAGLVTADAPGLVGRLDHKGVIGAKQAFGLTADGSPARFAVEYANSLDSFAKTAHREPRPRKNPLDRLKAHGPLDSRWRPPAPATGRLRSPFDMWVRATWSHAGGDQVRRDFGSLYLGTDYRADPSLLIGILTELDWTDDIDAKAGTATRGFGWMIGPYVEKRLSRALTFSGRAQWGLSSDTVGLATGAASFGSMRWFANARLLGDCSSGNWRFSPEVNAIYFAGRQNRYVDGFGAGIPAQAVSLGRLTFGPGMSYAFHIGRARFAPGIAIRGIWDFDQALMVDLDSGAPKASPPDIHARVEVRLPVNFSNGVSFAAEGYYGGIGTAGFHPYGASLKIKIPLG